MERVRLAYAQRHGAAQFALLGGAVAAYELLRLAVAPDWPRALRHARDVLGLERAAHVAWERPLQAAALTHAPRLVDALDVLYVGGQFVVTPLFFLWLYRRAPEAFVRFRDGFVAATALALLVAWAFPTAPPRLAGAGVEDTLAQLVHVRVGSVTDPAAAIPSLHVGWAVGVGAGLLLHARTRLPRAAGVLYPFAILATVLVTGNHFLVDAAAGIAVLALGFGAAAVLRLALRRGVEQPGSSPGS